MQTLRLCPCIQLLRNAISRRKQKPSLAPETIHTHTLAQWAAAAAAALWLKQLLWGEIAETSGFERRLRLRQRLMFALCLNDKLMHLGAAAAAARRKMGEAFKIRVAAAATNCCFANSFVALRAPWKSVQSGIAIGSYCGWRKKVNTLMNIKPHASAVREVFSHVFCGPRCVQLSSCAKWVSAPKPYFMRRRLELCWKNGGVSSSSTQGREMGGQLMQGRCRSSLKKALNLATMMWLQLDTLCKSIQSFATLQEVNFIYYSRHSKNVSSTYTHTQYSSSPLSPEANHNCNHPLQQRLQSCSIILGETGNLMSHSRFWCLKKENDNVYYMSSQRTACWMGNLSGAHFVVVQQQPRISREIGEEEEEKPIRSWPRRRRIKNHLLHSDNSFDEMRELCWLCWMGETLQSLLRHYAQSSRMDISTSNCCSPSKAIKSSCPSSLLSGNPSGFLRSRRRRQRMRELLLPLWWEFLSQQQHPISAAFIQLR